jgi:hypothetical protein
MRKPLSWLRILSLLMGLSLVLAACGTATATETQSPISTPAVGDAPEDADRVSDVVDIPDEAKEITDLVQQDLAEQLNISKDEIRVVSVTAVEWPDSSMGCPKPGMGYLDVITPGYRIVLTASGQTYTYHTGPDSFVLCDEERDDGGGDEVTPEPGMEALVAEAKQDLSKRLNIAVEEIVLKTATSVEWRNSSMGCPKPGMAYLDVVTPGYLIELEAKGQIYSYHAGSDSPFLCEDPERPLTRSDMEKRVMDAAKAHLAQKLDIATGAIEVVRVEPMQWPDASLGCPQPGMSYAQMVTPGYQIILLADGQEYDYRANYETAILCEK